MEQALIPVKHWEEQSHRLMITIEQLADLPLMHRATIGEEHLDEMGHMNVRWYIALYDAAAWQLFTWLGMDRAYFAEAQAGAFALKQFVQYLAEVRVGETVAIRSLLLGRSARRVHVLHVMYNETTGALASTMEVLAAHADLTIRRTSPFPPHVAAVLDERIAEHQRLSWSVPLSGAIQP